MNEVHWVILFVHCWCMIEKETQNKHWVRGKLKRTLAIMDNSSN